MKSALKNVLRLLLVSACANCALADDRVIVVAGRSSYDVEQSFGLVPDSFAESAGNRTKLQTELDDGVSHRYPYFFPSGVWHLDDTIVTPGTQSGRKFEGLGSDYISSGFSNRGSSLLLDAADQNVDFDGSTISATTGGTSDTITITGHAVTANDVGRTLEITGGANFEQGYYVVVDTGSGTWTLDRDCSIGAGSAMQGTSFKTTWRDKGWGNVYEGLHFRGTNNLATGTPKGGIGWHQYPREASGFSLPRGKATMRNCNFYALRVGLLFGLDMRQAYEEASDYVGDSFNHADTFTGEVLRFRHVDTCFYFRNEQSVVHTLRHIQVGNCANAIFYFERGGQLDAQDVEFVSGVRGSMLRLGEQSGKNVGFYKISGFGVDGGGGNFKLLEMDDRSPGLTLTSQLVVFEDGIIDWDGQQNYQTPIFEVKGGTKLIINRVKRLRPGSIRITRDPTTSQIPHVVVMGCQLEGCTNPEDVIDLVNSSQNSGDYYVDFYGNSDALGSTVYDDKRYTPLTP